MRSGRPCTARDYLTAAGARLLASLIPVALPAEHGCAPVCRRIELEESAHYRALSTARLPESIQARARPLPASARAAAKYPPVRSVVLV